jgi:hypothetical protein
MYEHVWNEKRTAIFSIQLCPLFSMMKTFFSILHSHIYFSNACTFLKSPQSILLSAKFYKHWKKRDLLASSSEFFLITKRSQFWFAINRSIFILLQYHHTYIIIIIQEVSDVENLGNWKLTVHFEWIISMDFHCSHFILSAYVCIYYFF